MDAMTLPISAVLIAKDAERHLDAVLAAASAAGCAELLVLDSASTDRTAAIAAARGARLEQQPFLGFGPQKNRAIALARHDWILSLDADEVLDAEGQAALTGLDLSDPARCWRIRRRTFVGSAELRHGHLNDAPIRLFNRTRTRFTEADVHESVPAAGPVADLPGSILHYSFRDAADLFARCGGYARRKAVGYRAAGRRCGGAGLLLRATAAFIKSYGLKLGCLDGRLGVVAALSSAVNASAAMAIASEPEEPR
jgi:glycosyltransferase involved in cell wall biosynthesis